MALAYTCPHCGYQGKAPEALAGKKVKCKSCGGILRLPELILADAVPFAGTELESIPTDEWDGATVSGIPFATELAGSAGSQLDAMLGGSKPSPSAGPETLDADELEASDQGEIPPGLRDQAAMLDADDLEDDRELDAVSRHLRGASTDLGPAPAPSEGPAGPRTGALPEQGLFGLAAIDPNLTAIEEGEGEPGSFAGFAPSDASGVEGTVEPPPNRPPGKDERHCPKCHAVIGKRAKICRYCGFDLNFEHLLTGETINIDLNKEREVVQAKIEASIKSPRRSVLRMVGAAIVLIGFFLPWLSGVFQPPRALSGLEVALILSGQQEPPSLGGLSQQDDGQEIGEEGDDAVSLPNRPGNTSTLRGRAPTVVVDPTSSPKWLTLGLIVVVPLLALVVLVWEATRGNTTIVLAVLPILAAALATLNLASDGFDLLGFGLYASVAGTALLLVPPAKVKLTA